MFFQCCAISFVENLTAESLSLDEEEFNMFMSGDKPVSTPWESALLACESLHLISENMKKIDSLKKRNQNIAKGLECFHKDLGDFDVSRINILTKTCNERLFAGAQS